MKNRMKKSDNRGTTLIEMIVTFALIGIFLAAAATVISSAIMTNGELTASMYAQNVGEMLLDKVTGELAAAQVKGEDSIVIGDTLKEGGTEGNGVMFVDREGNRTICMIQDGLLLFRQTADWKLDQKSYMGYRISDFKITRMRDQNILEVKLTLKNLKSGFEYSCSRCTKCYNFKTEDDFQKISTKEYIAQ